MTLIVTATGLAGFLASFTMLHLGLEKMWLRYPLAVGISYGVFLLLLRVWIFYQQSERSVLQDTLDLDYSAPGDFLPSGSSAGSFSRSGDSGGWTDWGLDLDGGEYVAMIALLVALLAALIASVWIVVCAPALLGEIFLDAIVITALRKKMMRVAEQHWTWGAIRRTAVPFLVTALIFSVAGGIIHEIRPEAKSIGGLFRTTTRVREGEEPI